MKTPTAVKDTINIVISTLTNQKLPFDIATIRYYAHSWYNYTDIVDAEILAASVLEWGGWFPTATYDDMLKARDKWILILKRRM